MNNRRFTAPLKLIWIAALALTLGAGLAARPAFSETIGLSVPLSGDYSDLGKRFTKGAKRALQKLGGRHRLFIADDGCDPDLASLAAEDLISQSIGIVGGFLCSDTATKVADDLADTKTPLLISNARSIRLIKDRERNGWNLWRFAPGDDYPVAAAAEAISQNWRSTPFVLVDDGTIYGRTFSDQLRLKLEELGITPQLSDSFRAAQSTQAGLLRRLQRSGASAAFIAASNIDDITTITKDIQRLEVTLDIMTTETLMALPYLQNSQDVSKGTKVIGWKAPSLPEDADAQDQDIIELQGFATIEIISAALGASFEETTKNLQEMTFETVLGQVKFNTDGSSTFNPYRLLEWDGQEFIPASSQAATQ